MRIFGGSRMEALMTRLGLPDDVPIENSLISRSIEGAQRKVEGHHFDTRKHLVQYDDVINTHRDIIYKRRNGILESESLKNDFIVLIEKEVERLVLSHPGDFKEVHQSILTLHKDAVAPIAQETLQDLDQEALIRRLTQYLEEEYLEKEKSLPDPALLRRAERAIMLRVLDMLWMRHISELKDLREAVSLSGYGQRDPLIEYKNLAFLKFDELMRAMDQNIVLSLFRVKINVQLAEAPPAPKTETNEKQIEAPLNSSDLKPAELGRNDLCHCGSGKKLKKCHGA
jgi:preprotein translocase subunit SecA